MTRFPAFPSPQCLLRLLTAALVAASAPGLAQQEGAGAADEETVTISAERMSGRPDREIVLERDVELIRGATTVYADRATYNIVEDEVEASGNIRMLRLGDTYTGDELRMRIAAGQGYVSQPTYILQRNRAQGAARRIEFENRDRATVFEGTYSTCEGPDPDWYLKSSRLKLDRERDEGVGYGTLVYFKGLPIMAMPLMSFPLSDARKSGMLTPSIGTTNRGGMEIMLPYYLNIAPNRDLTLYPKLYARRGLQLGVEARYLGETYSGETRVEGMPDDRITGDSRYALSSTHVQSLAPRWSFSWNLNHASDNDYPSDFARTQTAASQRLLARDLNLAYTGDFWAASARASNFQVLQDPTSPDAIVRPHGRLPQLSLYAGRSVKGFDWSVDSELTRFWHPTQARGERLFVHPRVSYPIVHPAFSLTPRLALHASTYHFSLPGDAGTTLSRVVPTASLDGGVVFERDATFFGAPMTQTLEPRLFYVYTPFRNQDAFPNFDTAEADVSFAQLFSENRFVGNDRIADANHVTAALVSRYLAPDGAERLRLALAQRYYLTPQRVTLFEGGVNEGRSDILVAGHGRITPALAVEGNVQYSQLLGTISRANYGARWQPAPMRVLNLQYRRDRVNNLEQVDVSGQWPFAARWYGVARVNYSLPDRRIAESLFGVEYKADCWVFRVVAQRTPTAERQATASIFMQIELTGLTRLGSNPLEVLRTNIPGYQLVN